MAEESQNLKLEEPASRGLSSRQVGSAIGVSDQTIRNWNRVGLPASGHDAWGRNLYDLETVKKWRADNAAEPDHGGARPRAGRKRGRRYRTRPEDKTPWLTRDEIDGAARRQESFDESERLKKRKEALSTASTAADRLAVMLLPEDEGGFTKSEATRVKEIYEAHAKQREEDEASGKLISKAETAELWKAFLLWLVRAIDDTPKRGVDRIMAALGPDAQLKYMPLMLVALSTLMDELKASVLEKGKGKDLTIEVPRGTSNVTTPTMPGPP